jgi:mitochondrial import inner membrane translocase subunit TIM44
MAGLKPSQEMGLRPDGQVLDIRGVDIVSAKLLPPADLPVFIIGFRTQEIHVYRDVKSGEIKAGVEDRIQQVTLPPSQSNPSSTPRESLSINAHWNIC